MINEVCWSSTNNLLEKKLQNTMNIAWLFEEGESWRRSLEGYVGQGKY